MVYLNGLHISCYNPAQSVIIISRDSRLNGKLLQPGKWRYKSFKYSNPFPKTACQWLSFL